MWRTRAPHRITPTQRVFPAYAVLRRGGVNGIGEGDQAHPREQVALGIENVLLALLKLFSGENFGKRVLAP